MGRTIFEEASVLDGDRPAQAGLTVVVEDDTIAAVGQKIKPRPGDRVLQLGGRTLMPGLVTCHFHSSYRDANPFPPPLGTEHPPAFLAMLAAENARTALMCGFTGAVGASCSHDIDASLVQAIEEGLIAGPRLVPSSRDLISTGSHMDVAPWQWGIQPEDGIIGGVRLCDGPDAYRAAVRDEIRRGARMIKIYPTGGHGVGPKKLRTLQRAELDAAIEAAHDYGMQIRGHIVTKDSILESVAAGIDVVDHADEMDEECIEAFVHSGCHVVPSVHLGMTLLDASSAESGSDPGLKFDDELRRELDHTLGMLGKANAAGVRLVVGDDYGAEGMPHGDYARELETYVMHAGIPALDVIRWATKNGGELLDPEGRVGTIAPGKIADLLIVDGDPSSDIRILQDPDRLLGIMRGGVFAKENFSRMNAEA
jgi:imidazolonepropionase-like amidohydrolase